MERENRQGGIDFRELAQRALLQIKSYASGYLIPRREGATDVAQVIDWKQSIQQIGRGLGTGVISFLFASAQFAMGSYPFGIALLCAAHERVAFSYLGMAVAALTQGSYALPAFLSYTLLLALRVGLAVLTARHQHRRRISYFEEPLLYRIAVGETVVFLAGLYRVLHDGFLYYDMFGVLFELALVPLLTALFWGVLEKQKRYSVYYEAGVAAMLGTTVYAMQNWTVFGYGVAMVAAFLITLYVSNTAGMLRGMMTGMICGLGCGLAYAPLFAAVGLVSGLLWQVGSLTSTVAAGVTAITFGFYIEGIDALQRLAPELIVGVILFLPMVQFHLLPDIALFAPTERMLGKSDRAALAHDRRDARTAARLSALTGTMHDLSDLLEALSRRLRKPGIYELRRTVTDTLMGDCANCAMQQRCWKQEHSRMVLAVDAISRTLQQRGSTTQEELPRWMQKECPRVSGIGAKLTLACAALTEQLRAGDKNAVAAADYEVMAKLVERAAEEDPEFEIDEDMSEKVSEAMRYMDLRAGSVAVFGHRRRTIVAGDVDMAHMRMSADALTEAFGNLCEVSFCPPRFDVDEGENGSSHVSMTMTATRRFAATCASATEMKEGETVNGDHISTFESGEDYFYTLISDGMGSGRDAALTSRLCGGFLEKMLCAYNPKDLSMEMLSNLIRNKGSECFATVDLLEVDLLNGRAGFIKSGAAPSYILRDGNLFRVVSNSMPIGITREINAEEICFDLHVGDVIVMFSDGIAPGMEESVWLLDLLCGGWEEDMQKMADRILREAQKRNARSDDMTVGLIRISAA